MNTKQIIMHGLDSYKKIGEILQEKNINKFLLVCDKAPYENSFIKEYIENMGVEFVIFSDFTPNPVYEEVKNGVEVFLKEGCQLIISIGGGSAIDIAKCIKLFSTMNQDRLYLEQEFKPNDVVHIAVPTTSGTGSESTHFAVMYYEGEKKSIAEQYIRPDYAILEPKLLVTVPDYQKRATVMDALCQAIESYWSVNSTDESKDLSRKSIDIILKNLDLYLKNDIEALSQMALASNYSGQAINITTTTAAHAMSYKITSMYRLSHGHAVGCCLPFVWRHMIDNMDKCVDPRGKEYLQKTFEELAEMLYCDDMNKAPKFMRNLMKVLKLPLPEAVSEKDLDVLASSVNAQRLANNPVALTEDELKEIYEYVLKKKQMKVSSEGKDYVKTVLGKSKMLEIIEDIQRYSLDILKDVASICEKQDIPFFLGEGTLLGAIRHNGFIPWDDDVDILMFRKDFDRFIKAFQKYAPEKYVLSSFETFDKHWTICIKVINKEVKGFEHERFSNVGLVSGPVIDIFPLDYLPEMDSKKIKNRGRLVDNLKYMLWYKTGYIKNPPSARRKLLKFLTKFTSYSFLRDSIIKKMTEFNDKSDNKYAVNYGSLYKIRKEIVPISYYGKARMVKFEDTMMPVPEKSEEILEVIYGDYMKLPPMKNRFPKHRLSIKSKGLNDN